MVFEMPHLIVPKDPAEELLQTDDDIGELPTCRIFLLPFETSNRVEPEDLNHRMPPWGQGRNDPAFQLLTRHALTNPAIRSST